MKTPITILSGALIALTALYAGPALADPAYATRNVNVRSGPGLNFEAVDQLVAGEPVDEGNCNADGSWCYVRHEGTDGWVAAVFLSATAPGQQPPSDPQQNPPSSSSDNNYKAKSIVNVRSGPNTTYAVVDRLDAGEAVTRGQCTADGVWCYITHDGSDGWVSAAFLVPANPTPPPSNPPATGPDTGTRIAISPVNIRTGPSTNFTIVGRLVRDESVEVAQCTADGAWCYVSHDGPDGWVAASYLRTPTPPGFGPGNQGPGNQGPGNQGPGGNPPQMVTQKIGTAIAGMPVRSAPTLFTATVGRLDRGQTIPVDQCTDDGYWCHVANDSIKGWVPAAFLTITETQVPAPTQSNAAVVAQPTAFRRAPGSNAALIGMLSAGTSVDVLSCGPAGNWCQVDNGQQTGWVAATALKAPESSPPPPSGQQPDNSVCITGFGGMRFCFSQ